jgi:hypothetical protein
MPQGVPTSAFFVVCPAHGCAACRELSILSKHRKRAPLKAVSILLLSLLGPRFA